MSQIRRFGRFFHDDNGRNGRHGNEGNDRRECTNRQHNPHSVTHQSSHSYYSDASQHDAHHQHYHHWSHGLPHENYSYHGNSSNSRFINDGPRVENQEWSYGAQTANHSQNQIANHSQSGDLHHSHALNSNYDMSSRGQTHQIHRDQAQSHHGNTNRKRTQDDTTREGEDSANSSKRLKGPSQHTATTSHTGFQGRSNSGFKRGHKTHVKQLTLVETLPYPAEGINVLYTNEPDKVESWLQSNVINNSVEAIGFDIEWKPQFIPKKLGGKENKTAVIQLSVEESCLVLHIVHMKNHPQLLSEVLLNRNVLKVGSGINGDVIKLLSDTGILCDGRVDTQEYAKALGMGQGLGLKNLAKEVLDIDLDKPKSISTSNWDFFPLKKRQIHYAALDAWISLKLFLKLKEQLAKENEGKANPKTVQVHCGKPVLGKKARKENKKQMIQELLLKRAKGESDSSTVESEGLIASGICENQTPTTTEIRTGEGTCTYEDATSVSPKLVSCGSGKSERTSEDATSVSPKLVSCSSGKSERTSEDTTSVSPKLVSCGSGKSAAASVASNVCEKGQSTTAEIGHKEIVSSDDNTVFLLCPIAECKRVKFTLQQELQEHIKTKHVSCKMCGKLYRSKVSAKHKKQHAKEQGSL